MAVMIQTNPSQAGSVLYREDKALQEKSSALKQDSMVNETPAYRVEISENYNGKGSEDITEPFKKMIEDFKDGNLSKIDFGDNSKEAMDNFKGEFQNNITKFASTISSLTIQKPLHALRKGDLTIAINFSRVEDLVKSDDVNSLHTEAQEALDKYYNAGKYIEQGGKDTFLQYNLRFAAIAAYENDKQSDSVAKQQITAGQYSDEEYSTAKNYAKTLQAKAGVFVSTDFVCAEDAREVATGITYSYNGLVCAIGTEELNFMSKHDEAQNVWIKAAQGEYKNNDDIVQALRDGGYKDVANQFAIKCTGETRTETGALSEQFMSGHTSSKDDYQDLYQKIFGDNEIKPRYSAQELHNAYYEEGQQGSEDFKKYPLDREPMTDRTHTHENDQTTATAKSNTPGQRTSSLQAELRTLQKQLTQIQQNPMAKQEKEEMIKKIQNSMTNIQLQINTIHENSTKSNI